MIAGTWNVNGIRARFSQLLEWIERDRPDVFALQELKATPEQIPPALGAVEDGYWSYWHGGKAYSGVSLHFSRAAFAEPRFSHPEFDHETRIVCGETDGFVAASVYVPNGGKDFAAKLVFLEALDAFAAASRASSKPLLLMGDFNVAREERDVHPKERRAVVGQLPVERAWIERLLEKGLVDVGRAMDPDNDNLFTWWAPWRNMKQRNIGWRLDYVFASEALATRAVRSVVQREVGTSDHGPVLTEFS
jgi:exodeoxyribonuclease-3